MSDRVTVVDLFAGIGGIRLGFQQAADELGVELECVFTSELDRFAAETYETNFGGAPLGDITDPEVQAQIPDEFDVLLAGFPCQPFSLAGVSKKNSLGRAHGFDDKTSGTLFHEIAKILDRHQPRAFFLENVKHLRGHDGGQTFKVITHTLKDLGYDLDERVINASTRVPQNRERIYFVGFRNDLGIKPSVPELLPQPVRIRDILHEEVDDGSIPRTPRDRADRDLPDYTLSDNLWTYLQKYAEKHRRLGNGFGFGLVEDLNGITRTLSARYHKDGSEILIPQKGRNPRRLTPRECARLQGFPEDFVIPCSDTQSYRQFGNSVAVPVIRDLAAYVIPLLSFESAAAAA